MSDARQALHAARTVGGDRYSPLALEQAQELIERASQELSAGNYKKARAAANAAKQRAILAREAALAVQGGSD